MKEWKVKYMARGMEPPHPFGKSEVTVKALTREEAIEKVKQENPVSRLHPITASAVKAPKCRHCKSTNLEMNLGELRCRDCLWYQK